MTSEVPCSTEAVNKSDSSTGASCQAGQPAPVGSQPEAQQALDSEAREGAEASGVGDKQNGLSQPPASSDGAGGTVVGVKLSKRQMKKQRKEVRQDGAML